MSNESLRIAMIAPPWFDLPPSGYGGIEAMCADLVDALVARGHEVTLIATGRDGTRAHMVRTYDVPQGPRLGEALPEVVHAAAAGRILQDLDVDVVHDHTLAGPLLARGREVPTVVTVHGPVDGEPGDYYRHLGDSVHLVAISDAQRRRAPDLNWCGTVHNAVHASDFPYRQEKEDWALFLGRCTPDKGMHLAIDAARAAGRTIRLSGKCSEPAEKAYFDAEIRPRLGPGVEWLGEASDDRKKDLLARARCLLFPLQWEEPFGMVMIEAMACGTPVVALRRGSVPEVIDDGVTGLIRQAPEELPEALEAVGDLDPAQCRKSVVDRFQPDAMAAGYEAVYRRLATTEPKHPAASAGKQGAAAAKDLLQPVA